MLDAVYQYLLRFTDISREEFASIVQFAEVRHFDRKVKLVELGEKDIYLNFVVKGLLRKFFYRGKEEVITQLATEGDLICSSVSFLSGDISNYVVETLEPSTVVSITSENIEKMYSMNTRMERMGRLIIIDWLLQKEYWENARLKLGPKQRFVDFVRNNPALVQRVPQKLLASYLNIKPETFSRYKHLLRA